jgi:Ceramidase
MSKRARVLLICAVVFLAAIGVAFMHRIPQPQDYYNFADHRSLLGIPNFMDVVSNIPFLLAGLWGLSIVFSRRSRESFETRAERWAYAIFFLGAALTCFGSAYFHWNPNDSTLVWDRLPMTLAFMSIVAAIIGERISPRAGSLLLFPLLLLGVASVFLWHSSELRGTGDLRLYLCVQFFPVLVILLALLLFEPKYTRGGDFSVVLGFYALAKLLEALDRPIYNLGHLVSGHTLKHLAAAMAVVWLARMIQKRRPVPVFRSRTVRV